MSGPVISPPPLASLRDSFSGRQTENTFNSGVIVPAMATLCVVVLLVVSLHVYARCFSRRGETAAGRWSTTPRALSVALRQWRHRQQDLVQTEGSMVAVDPSLQECIGLDAATVDSLPTFVYEGTAAPDSVPLLDCAVCLSEFQLHDKGRTLPSCRHSFHADCVDLWLRSHSTCPLCRTAVITLPSPRQELLARALSDRLPPFLHQTAVLPTLHMHQEHGRNSHAQPTQRSSPPLFLLQNSSTSMAALHENDQEPPRHLPSMAGLNDWHLQQEDKLPSHGRVAAAPACIHIPATSASVARIPSHQEFIQRGDVAQVTSPAGRGASESSLIRQASLRQQERVGMPRSASLSFSRSRTEEAQESLPLQLQKSSSLRMSIRWLVSRELSRGRSRVFPSGKVNGEPEQSSTSCNMSSPV